MAKYDEFVDAELNKILKSGENVLGKALIWQGPGIMLQLLLLGPITAWLFMKYYFAVITDQRLILMHTKMGFASGLKKMNMGVVEVTPKELSNVETKGAMNQRRVILSLKNGSSRTLRLNTFASYVSGQKEFAELTAKTLKGLI